MKIKIFFVILIILILPIGFSFAQSIPLFDMPVPGGPQDPYTGLPSGIEEQVSFEVFPNVPSPNEQVSISAESFASDFDKAYFTWSQNGRVFEEGTGIKAVNFLAPPSGQTLEIDVVINKEEGGTITRNFSFSPAEVDIVYESNTYTPPFYKGKALFTSEADIRFVAMPNFVLNGTTINPNTLTYTWSLNGTVDQSQSGYGRRVYVGKGGLIQRPFTVEVEVSATNSGISAKDSVYITSTNPQVVVYEKNPLLGSVFEKAIEGSFNLDRQEVEFQSVPFFFSTNQKESSLVDYSWMMNGQKIEVGSRSSYIRFRNETGEEGTAQINLDVNHFTNLLQTADSNLILNFESINENNENNLEF